MSEMPRTPLAFLFQPRGKQAPGIAASVLLHLTALLAAILMVLQAEEQPLPALRVVPVDVVLRLGYVTSSTETRNKAPVPLSAALRTPRLETANPRPHEGAAPARTKPLPLDDFDAKLRALARLRLPQAKLPALDNAGTSEETATSDGAVEGEAMYSLKDFVRAQVERRWNLDFSKLGPRRFAIPLRIVMRSDGRIERAEIVDRERYVSDAVYRSISLSARNAVLLSSPIALPPGRYDDVMRLTLVFNPADMRQ